MRGVHRRSSQNRESVSKLATATTVFLVATLPVAAGQTTFNPSIAMGSGYTNNVEYLGEPDDSTGDTVTTATFVLPVVHQQYRGALRLTYRTGWYLYGDESQNDSNQQSLTFGLNRTTRRRSTWTVASRYFKTEEQQASPILPTEITPAAASQVQEWLVRVPHPRRRGLLQHTASPSLFDLHE